MLSKVETYVIFIKNHYYWVIIMIAVTGLLGHTQNEVMITFFITSYILKFYFFYNKKKTFKKIKEKG